MAITMIPSMTSDYLPLRGVNVINASPPALHAPIAHPRASQRLASDNTPQTP
jgi:hypothetical protein